MVWMSSYGRRIDNGDSLFEEESVTTQEHELSKAEILSRKVPLVHFLPGIYFLINGEEIVYVGQSKSNIMERVASHADNKTFDSYTVLPISNNADLDMFEAFYIMKFAPRYNAQIPSAGVYYTITGLKKRLNTSAWPIKRLVRQHNIKGQRVGTLLYYDIRDFKELKP